MFSLVLEWLDSLKACRSSIPKRNIKNYKQDLASLVLKTLLYADERDKNSILEKAQISTQ